MALLVVVSTRQLVRFADLFLVLKEVQFVLESFAAIVSTSVSRKKKEVSSHQPQLGAMFWHSQFFFH